MGGLIVGDNDRTVAARPQALTPPVESSSLFGDVGVPNCMNLASFSALGGDRRKCACVPTTTKAWMVIW
jgi:hypothetical protein